MPLLVVLLTLAGANPIDEGRTLFVHEWSPGDRLAAGDGLGPLFNARS